MSNAGDKPVVTQRARDELAALGYSVVDAHNDIVESGWLMRPPCITDRAWIAATEDDAWAAAACHRERDTLSREGREADPYRILKDALFALERQSADPVSYGGVLTNGGRRAWIAYGLFDEGTRPVFFPPASEGRDVGREEPYPGCFADLQRRRVTTLAKLGLMLSIMAGGEAAEVVGYDAADLYAEVIMALAIEDAEDTDIALEEARDHPEGDMLAALSTPPAPEQPEPFQDEVARWMLACFGEDIAADQLERADRFTEEALELAQTMPGFTAERAHALVDYVFGRPVGERQQEVGGIMVTLAALCNTCGISIDAEAKRELARIWTKVDVIRAKQAAKPTGSALPIAAPEQPDMVGELVEATRGAEKWLRAISDWLLENDHDMTLPSGVLDTDPLDIADDIAAALAKYRSGDA